MTLLIIGLALWILIHWFKRLAPNLRASLGDAGKGIVAVLLVVGLVLMIIGYRGAPYIAVWTPLSFLVHVNNLLMVVAVAVFAMSHNLFCHTFYRDKLQCLFQFFYQLK